MGPWDSLQHTPDPGQKPNTHFEYVNQWRTFIVAGECWGVDCGPAVWAETETLTYVTLSTLSIFGGGTNGTLGFTSAYTKPWKKPNTHFEYVNQWRTFIVAGEC